MPIINKQTPTQQAAPQQNGAQSAWDVIDNRLTLLLYGDSGTGKTTMWGTFPGPTLALICSGAGRPGELRSINTPEHRKKITPKIITESSQILDELGRGNWTTVVLDHVSGLAGLLLKEYMGLADIPAVKSWGMASQADWANINLKTIEILRHLLNAPGNVVVVGQERIFKGKEEVSHSDIIKPAIGVAVSPGVASWLRPAVDYEVQTFKRPKMVSNVVELAGKQVDMPVRGKGVDYCIRTEPHDIFMTKFRVPLGTLVPDLIVNPTYEKLVAAIQGKLKE